MCNVIVINKGEKEIETPQQFADHFGFVPPIHEYYNDPGIYAAALVPFKNKVIVRHSSTKPNVGGSAFGRHFKQKSMAAINNLKGTPVKDGKVVYSEELETSLHFAVILMYEPFYEGKNTANHQHSTQLFCEAVITTGSKHNWGNGINSLEEADWFEKVRDNKKFEPLKPEIRTKDGFKVWQVEYSFSDFEITKEQFEKSKNSNYDFLNEEDKNDLQKQGKIKFKTRRVKWLVEVPKMSMLKMCGVS